MDFVGGGHGFESHHLFTLILFSTLVLVSKLSKLNFRYTKRTDTTIVGMDLGSDDLRKLIPRNQVLGYLEYL